MTRIKICGITNQKDALQAQALGAHAIGIILAKSPRRVSVHQAKLVSKTIAPFTTLVGVFVNESTDKILTLRDKVGFRAVQLHGQESLKQCLQLHRHGLRIIKAIAVNEDCERLSGIKAYPEQISLLFDTQSRGRFGGTGKAFNWNLLSKLRIKNSIIVSGGLNASNVSKAIQTIKPYAVDVSSAVESSPGIKDFNKLRLFIKNAQ